MHVHRIIIFFILALPSLAGSAERVLDIQTGSTDLLKNEQLSAPFTLFSQLLYSLERKVREESKYIRPEGNDFRVAENHDIYTSLQYEKENFRVGVVFDLKVKGMDDPWTEVCERHVRKLALNVGILGTGSNVPYPTSTTREIKRMFFENHLGPMILYGSDTTSLQPFLDALVVIGNFSVVTPDRKSLAFSRWCALDINNEHMSYFEHKF